jgi:hypothetical protein
MVLVTLEDRVESSIEDSSMHVEVSEGARRFLGNMDLEKGLARPSPRRRPGRR